MRTLHPAEADSASAVLVRWILLFPTALFACLTVEIHFARAIELSFRTLALAAALTAILIGCLTAVYFRREWRQVQVRDVQTILVLVLAALIGAAFASFYARPDGDDHLYVPDAVFAMTFPEEPLGYEVHFLYQEPPIQSVVVGTAQPFEYAQALLAYGLGVEFLFVYHILVVALVGAAVPLATYSLLRHLSEDTLTAALAAGLSILILTLMGETKYTPGSLSFTRLFQGKAVLLTAGIPYFVGESLAFFRRPGLQRWVQTGIVATALCGMSSTAFFLVPMASLATGIGCVAALRVKRPVLILACYGISNGYLVAYALYASQTVGNYLGAGGEGAGSWPAHFSGYVMRVFGASLPVSGLILLVSFALGAVLLHQWRRVFLIAWVAANVVLFANPVIAPVWIKLATGPAVYWRVFYAVPATALIGSGLIGLLQRPPIVPYQRTLAVSALIAVVVALSVNPAGSSIFHAGGTIGWPRYKVNEGALDVARVIVDRVPPGVMLAQEEFSGAVGMVRGGYPQLRIRVEPMYSWLAGSEGEQRLAASDFTGGDIDKEAAFRWVLERHPELSTIVIKAEPYRLVAEGLRRAGFSHQWNMGKHLIVWRTLFTE